jgi:hypothetical protein
VTWTTWWLIAATATVLSFTPGPAVLFVVSSALRVGAKRGIPAILAILAANSLYFALSATDGHRRVAGFVIPFVLCGEMDRRGGKNSKPFRRSFNLEASP